MKDERCKQIMEQLGMPQSRSLMQALFQVANETEQEVRKKLAADNGDYAKCLSLARKIQTEMGSNLNHEIMAKNIQKHFT